MMQEKLPPGGYDKVPVESPLAKLVQEAFECDPKFRIRFKRQAAASQSRKPSFEWLQYQLTMILGTDRIEAVLAGAKFVHARVRGDD